MHLMYDISKLGFYVRLHCQNVILFNDEFCFRQPVVMNCRQLFITYYLIVL